MVGKEISAERTWTKIAREFVAPPLLRGKNTARTMWRMYVSMISGFAQCSRMAEAEDPRRFLVHSSQNISMKESIQRRLQLFSGMGSSACECC